MSWDDEDETEEGWFDNAADSVWGRDVGETAPSSSASDLPSGPVSASSLGLPSGPIDTSTVDEKMEELKDEMESVKRKMEDLTIEGKSSSGLPSGPIESSTRGLPSGPDDTSASGLPSGPLIRSDEPSTRIESEKAAVLSEASELAKKKKKRRRKKKKANTEGLKKCHECGKNRPEESGEQRGAHWYCGVCATKVQCQECMKYVFPEDGKEDSNDRQFYCFACWRVFDLVQKAEFKKVDPSTYLSGSRIERMERAKYKDW